MKNLMIARRHLLAGAACLTLPGTAWAALLRTSAGDAAVRGNPAPASKYIWPVHDLLAADVSKSLFVRNLGKAAFDVHMIDNMESDLAWTASSSVQLSYTYDRAKTGTRSLRFSSELRSLDYIRSHRRENGSFSASAALFDFDPSAPVARLRFAQPQDWSQHNRLSLWCYLHPTGNPVSSLCIQFICEGASAGPTDPVAIHYFSDLQAGEWNLLVWEFPEMARGSVTEFSIFQPATGVPFRDLPSAVTYDFDMLQLERVSAEQVDGWDIAPGKIAYSHLGYRTAGPKLAMSGASSSSEFHLIDANTGNIAATLPAHAVKTRRGSYTIHDFTAFTQEGEYRIRAGDTESEAFGIGQKPWRPLVEATLNAFYGLRCGFTVPGVHEACHCDVFARYNGESRVVGGGWHDAANLSQDPENTHVSICALLDLAERLVPHDTLLAERALEEARWGLEWVSRMRFAPGIRYLYGGYSYYTDSIPGNEDDSVQEIVGFDAFRALTATLAEVRGARALREIEPERAAELLAHAEEDFAAVLRERPVPRQDDPVPRWNIAGWQNEAGYMALTAIHLYSATGKREYADAATRMARWVLDLQEVRFVDGSPITGYFYEDAARQRILHEDQRTSGAYNSFEEGALLALAALCQALPDHPEWTEWYAGLLAYSEYFCRKGSEASAPFEVVPAALWREVDLERTRPLSQLDVRVSATKSAMFPTPATLELVSRQKRDQFDAGVPLSPTQRLRMFPIWLEHVAHGGTAVHLTKTIGLAAAAQVRGGKELTDLAWRQVEWLVGANPFSRSLVYGVGYDWWQNFAVSLPNLVGGLSVGMNSYQGDSPAWGNNAVFPYKELWVLSSARLTQVLALIIDKAPLHPPAQTPRLQLHADPVNAAQGNIHLHVAGTGAHRIELRSWNLDLPESRLTVEVGAGGARDLVVPFRMRQSDRPWLVVAIPDGDISKATEMFGTVSAQVSLA